MMRFVYEPYRPRHGARELPHVLLPEFSFCHFLRKEVSYLTSRDISHGARELPHVLLPADEPVVTFLLNSPIPYGAHEPSHQYQTATLASIEEGTTIVVPTSLKRLDVRPLTHILPLDLQSEWTLSPNGRPSKFSFCHFLRKEVSYLTSRDIMV
jgi:hypothetical protein